MKPKRVAIVGADWPVYEKFCPNFVGMQLGLQELGIDHRLFSCRPALDEQGLIEYAPDLVVYGLIDMIKDKNARHIIREALPNAKIVMWYGDLRNEETGQITADASEINAMFVSNDAQQDFYKSQWRVPECHFLPLGSPIYTPAYNKRYDFDFVFIGGMITGRKFLRRAETMILLQQKGLQLIDAPADRKPDLRAKILKSMPTIYHSSKVSLDWSHFTDIPGYTSNRFWIITASNGFALTKRWPGCETWYPEGTRAYFDSLEECLELAEYYRTHPVEREKIRAAGYAHAQHHTYASRFKKMFDIIYA